MYIQKSTRLSKNPVWVLNTAKRQINLSRYKRVMKGELPKKLLCEDPQLLRFVYHDPKLQWTQKKIVKESTMSIATVRKNMWRFGILGRSKRESGRLRDRNDFPINQYLHELLTGELLSDGHVERRLYQGRFKTDRKYSEYIDFLTSIFGAHGYPTNSYKGKDKRSQRQRYIQNGYTFECTVNRIPWKVVS